MQANSSGAEFLSNISKYMKRMNFVIACLRPLTLHIFMSDMILEAMDRKQVTALVPVGLVKGL